MKFCYIILHYKNINETIKCIESLKNTASEESTILVVDNGSGDGSGEKLQDLYKDTPSFSILLLEENLGFSKGNNQGFIYAKNQWNPDFMIFTNNDVVFYQNNFEQKINAIYRRTNFDVLGPDIYIPNNQEHQSPLFLTGITSSELEKELEEYRFYQKQPEKFTRRLQLHFVKNRLCTKYPMIRRLYAMFRKKDSIDFRKEYCDVGLQGSCIIVSKTYIEEEEKMFSPEPFLYCEEVFLYYKCKKRGYKIVYSPEIGIRHEEAASFKNASKNMLERNKFMLEHHVASRELLLNYLREYEKVN